MPDGTTTPTEALLDQHVVHRPAAAPQLGDSFVTPPQERYMRLRSVPAPTQDVKEVEHMLPLPPHLLVKETRALEPEQFAVFDPSSGDDVELFCRRIQDMAYVKGSVAVCEVLPRCLHNSAMYWYMSLDEVDRTQMR
ncbi:uncharacterized protein UMAG_10997 [Mycosarcoma maydis]|uniref:Uncharacterized protein n=1 Tax=Mycosarcoma maydis TaxID=5270 RepID=A0A0D1DT12_MYCMD|nr:uncharacterized protein UMAG_10997 [Ustilago maydis 521]KIS65670.1 hypothetical protein UMAG_10997 [Ustilago maydis 521]|eukprot:XP_011392737.1 hypothetical protein UMAG_10997 [Ustilago maydis 521]